jgi:hypothetical protein
VPEPDPFAPQLGARRLHLDERLAERGEQLGGAAQQRGRIAADADVPVGEQDGHPSAGPRHPAEHVAQQRERAGRLGHAHGMRGDVDAKRGDAALGQGHGEPPRPGSHIECRADAPRDKRVVSRTQAQPVAHSQRRRGAVRVLDLGLRVPGEGLLVEYADHAGPPEKRKPIKDANQFSPASRSVGARPVPPHKFVTGLTVV